MSHRVKHAFRVLGAVLGCLALLSAPPARADQSGCLPTNGDEQSWTFSQGDQSADITAAYVGGGVSWTVEFTAPVPRFFAGFVPAEPGGSYSISRAETTFTWEDSQTRYTYWYQVGPLPICQDRQSQTPDAPTSITNWDRDHAFERLTQRGLTRNQIENAVDNPVAPPSYAVDDLGRPGFRYQGNDGTTVVLNLQGELVTAF